MPTPTRCRIVQYRLRHSDAEAINRRRADARAHMTEHRENANGVQVHVGNSVRKGDIFPLVIVHVWDNEYADGTRLLIDGTPTPPEGADYAEEDFFTPESHYGINGQLILDGNDTLWITSAPEGDFPGCWSWPEHVQ